jgi:hypothetical protein
MDEWLRRIGGMILAGGNRNTLRKTCPSATLSTTNAEMKEGLRGERPAINRKSHFTALWQIYIIVCLQ